MVGITLLDMLHICFIGYVEKKMSTGSLVVRDGRGQLNTKLVHPMDLG